MTLVARYNRLTFWNKIAFWGSIASILGIPLGIWFYCASASHKYSALETEFNRLLKQSADTEAVATAFRVKVEAISASSDTAGRLLDDPQLKRLGKDLREAATSFDARYHSQLTPDMALEVRLVRGIAANAEGNFQAAQELVSDKELQTQNLHIAQMLLIRADAALGLEQFPQAMNLYQRLLIILPNSVRGLLGVATCLGSLGQSKQAILINTAILAMSEQSDLPINKAISSSSLNNRGVAHLDLEQYSNAIVDFSQALEIAQRSPADEDYGLRDHIPVLLNNRGFAYCEWGNISNALADHNLALSLSSSLTPNTFFNNELDLSRLLLNRANDYNELGLYSNSIIDLNRSIGILKPLALHGHVELQSALAAALVNRGIAYREQGHITNSITEFSQAINLVSELIHGGRGELSIKLAKCFMNRGIAYLKSQHLDNALNDFDRCIGILNGLSADGQPAVARLLASALMNRGSVYFQKHSLTNALEDSNTCVDILQIMIGNGRRDVIDDLARAYGNRGSTYLALQRLTNALEDYSRSIERWDAIDEHRQPEQISDLAQRLISRASVVLQFNQWSNYMADCSRAISLSEPLAESQRGSLKMVGIALCYRANGYDHLMDRTNAIKDYTRSISILTTLATNREPDVMENLEKALFNCGNNCKVEGQLAYSIEYYSRAIAMLDQSTESTPEPKGHLATIVKCRALTYCACGEIANAISDCRRYESCSRGRHSVEVGG